MAFTVLSGTGGSLSVDVPPRVMSRYQDGGPGRTVNFGLAGEAIVMEVARTQDEPYLRLRFEVLSAAQVTTLGAILDAGGLISVKTHAAATAVSCCAAPRVEQLIEPIAGHHPDKTRDGTDVPAVLTPCRAEIVLLRME